MTAPSNTAYVNGISQVTGDNLNTFGQWITTVAQLRAFAPNPAVPYMTVYLQGYTAANDGGEGSFYWNTVTGTDDAGVTTVVPTGSTAGCWTRLNLNGSLLGTVTNNSAAAGYVGEYISSTVLSGSALSITTATPLNITSISLTAGDWDVWGNVVFVGASSTVTTQVTAAISTTTATLPTLPGGGGYAQISGTLGTTTTQVLPTGITRISIASTTTVYLVAQAAFTTSTMSGYGALNARRVR